MSQDPITGGMHGPSPILGPDGRPLRRQLAPAEVARLGDEVAAAQLVGVRTFYDDTVAAGLTPARLAQVMRECVRGDIKAYLTLAEEMEERDLAYRSVLDTRKRALSRIAPSLIAESVKGVDPKIAQACRTLLEEPRFHDLVKDLLDGLGKGFSVCEIVWCFRGGLWTPEAYRHRDPRFFTFDYLSRTELRLAEFGSVDGSELPTAKFVRHVPKLKSGIPIRGGIARTVAWAWMFKSFTLKDWMAFLDVYGMPLRVGKYHPNATEAERRTLLRAVASIASDAAAIIPESMQIDFVEAKGFADKPFETMGRYLDDSIATFVLGQTLTTRDGGSLGQAKVHNTIRLDLAEDDAFELGVTIDEDLLAWFVALNFGADVPVPRCEFPVPKPEDIAVLSTALGVLVPLGLEVDQEDVRSKMGLAAPPPGAKLLKPPAVPSAAGKPEDSDTKQAVREAALNHFMPRCACAACRTGRAIAAEGVDDEPEPDLVDQIGLDESRDWQNQTGPILDAVMAAAAQATTYAEFQAALNALAGSLPTKGLERRLAIGGTEARGLGEATDHV